MIYTPAPPSPVDNNGRPLWYHREGNEWLSQTDDQLLLVPYEIETEEQKTAAAKYIEWANGSD